MTFFVSFLLLRKLHKTITMLEHVIWGNQNLCPGTTVHNWFLSKLSLGACAVRAADTCYSLETLDKEFRASQNWYSKVFSAFSYTLFDYLWISCTCSFILLCVVTH